MIEERALYVKGWLNRHLFRQFCDRYEISWREDRGDWGSTFHVVVDDEQWHLVQAQRGVEG